MFERGFLILVIAVLAMFGGETIFKKARCPLCGKRNCDHVATTISIQDFHVKRIRNKNGSFTYAPVIILEVRDSTLLERVLRFR